MTFDRQYGVKSVNIELKSEQEQFIRSQIESGEYQNADDVISEALKKAIKEGAAILFQDESTFMLWTGAAYSWGERGKKLFASINMSNAVKKVFGAIERTYARPRIRHSPISIPTDGCSHYSLALAEYRFQSFR